MVTHQLQVEHRTGKVRLSKTDVLPTVPRNILSVCLLSTITTGEAGSHKGKLWITAQWCKKLCHSKSSLQNATKINDIRLETNRQQSRQQCNHSLCWNSSQHTSRLPLHRHRTTANLCRDKHWIIYCHSTFYYYYYYFATFNRPNFRELLQVHNEILYRLQDQDFLQARCPPSHLIVSKQWPKLIKRLLLRSGNNP